MGFKAYRQLNAMDCGPTCLKMIAGYYGKNCSIDNLRQAAGFSKIGVSLLGLSDAAERIGFRTRGVQLTFKQLTEDVPLPCILHWNQYHFVVALPTSGWRKKEMYVADPSKGIVPFNKNEFLAHWSSKVSAEGEMMGTALLLEPTPKFFEEKGEKKNGISWKLVTKYLSQSKWQVTQVFLSLIIISILQLILPFLMQSIVDTGIGTQNLRFIFVILIAQLVLVFSKATVDFIRTRLLLQISTVVNLSILSDFWTKLTKLPMHYFEQHHTGDTLQRIGDHKQIQNFLTGTALNTIFSLLNFVLFSGLLAWYHKSIFGIFAIGNILYLVWVLFFLRIRRNINYQTFYISAKENNTTLQLVQGMQEIKLHNAEQLKRWEWEDIQSRIFKLNLRSLTYSQVQQAGALLITQGKDLLITFFVARLVVSGDLTLGAMLAIQYTLGQLAGPVDQFVSFIQSAQDAKISMERLNEVHQLQDEEDSETSYHNSLPAEGTIHFKNVSFTYPGAGNEPVLSGLNFNIPSGKITAIVGISGSGKTTLLKLLLKFFDSFEGSIKIGEHDFNCFSPSFWRRHCGAVLQDGYIFNDTIARNIAVGDESPDLNRLRVVCKTANILAFVESLPNGFHTLLGLEGTGISQGQKQRILIARAVYKNPEYLFFDEATNALDANNEKAIVENLQDFFRRRTVVIVAHRLSTVKNADKIIVLQDGVIVEEGTHETLSAENGMYFELVKNQLALGK